jgi:ribosomal protein L24E
MIKCQCGREANQKNFVKIENGIVYFCSSSCVWNYLKQRFQEGKVFAGAISEE